MYASIIRNGRKVYVAQLPSKEIDCADWGWTDNYASKFDPAIKLSPYWQKRFLADQRACGRDGQLSEHP